MTPEERARRDIDRQLARCGWIVQSWDEMNLSAGLGIAVREFPMTTGEADYLLYAAGKAIGVVEAQPKGHPLIGVETQSARYAGALPAGIPAHRSPLPFSYESTGAVTQFTNLLEPDARSREVFAFHRPEELLQEFRTGYNPHTAVTVDMIATGTDVKPLECLLFLRNVKSAAYFEQMKGRGCRRSWRT